MEGINVTGHAEFFVKFESDYYWQLSSIKNVFLMTQSESPEFLLLEIRRSRWPMTAIHTQHVYYIPRDHMPLLFSTISSEHEKEKTINWSTNVLDNCLPWKDLNGHRPAPSMWRLQWNCWYNSDEDGSITSTSAEVRSLSSPREYRPLASSEKRGESASRQWIGNHVL